MLYANDDYPSRPIPYAGRFRVLCNAKNDDANNMGEREYLARQPATGRIGIGISKSNLQVLQSLSLLFHLV